MTEFPNIILYAIPFFIAAMLLELYVTTKENIKTIDNALEKVKNLFTENTKKELSNEESIDYILE